MARKLGPLTLAPVHEGTMANNNLSESPPSENPKTTNSLATEKTLRTENPMQGVPSDILRCMAALKALEETIEDLRAVIASILELYHSMPEGEVKECLLMEISSLDAIADAMQKAFDSMKEE